MRTQKHFYEQSINIEAQKFLELMRKDNDDAEQKLVTFLVRQAVHVGLGHFHT